MVSGPVRRFFLFVVAVFVAASLVNIAWEWRLPPQNSGLRTHPDANLSTLVHVEQPTLWSTHGFVSSVHDIARLGVVVVPEPDAVDQFLMRNLAQVDVVVEDYSTELTEDPTERFPESMRITGEGIVAPDGEWTGVPEQDWVRWIIVWDPELGSAESMRLFTWKSLPVLIDERLVEGP